MQEIFLGLGNTGSGIGLGELVDGVRFWGEVPVTELITGDALAIAIGLTGGTDQYSNEPWLHFELDGKTLYVAKKPYRNNLSWNHIHNRAAAMGTTTVTIQGRTYKVRLLTGANTNPTPPVFGYNPIDTEESEWNRLIYTVHNGVHGDHNNTTPPGAWPLYSDADLVVLPSGGSGSWSWCQETNATSTGQRVCRGSGGVTVIGFYASSAMSRNFGWRPVLELIP